MDRVFQKKTNELVQQYVGTDYIQSVSEVMEINESTVEYIVAKKGGDGNKVINLVKSIERKAEEQSDDPCLIAMAERARAVQESFEARQTGTAEALAALLQEAETNETRKKSRRRRVSTG